MSKSVSPQLWPAEQVERVPITELIPYARNTRSHDAAQVSQIAASLLEWGWTYPVLRDEAGVIIAGHGRVLAAQLLIDSGKTQFAEVPVMTARGWTPAQVQAYRIADNKLALNSDWDADMLRVELGELKDFGFDLDLTGFATNEVDELFHGWTSDDSAVTRHGENLDGIEAKVTVRCPQGIRDDVLARVSAAVAGIEGVTVE